jgi:hypothetical protein
MAPATLTTPAVEVWKDIEGFEGYYEVSSHGRIRSVERDIVERNGNKIQHIKGRIRKQIMGTMGYYMLHLNKDVHYKSCFVHRLVAEAFIPNPENKPEVNHIDSVRHHNNVNNLEWVTHSENMKHSYNKGINTEGITKYRESERKRVTNGSETFVSISSAAEWLASCGRAKNKTSAIAGISAVIRNRRKTFGGYKWSVV